MEKQYMGAHRIKKNIDFNKNLMKSHNLPFKAGYHKT